MSHRPRIFIGSSSEGLSVAAAIRDHISATTEPRLWNEPGMFRLGFTTLDSLKAQTRQYSAAVFVFTPDDLLEHRGHRYLSGRDNVLFELGLFMGVLPAHRVLYAVPKHDLPFKIPSDLAGYQYGTYDWLAAKNNPTSATQDLAALIQTALVQALPHELPVRSIRGEMRVRNLRAIGPETPHEVDPVFSYRVTNAEMVIDATRVSVRGKVQMAGPVNLDGVFEGHGEFLHGGAYVIYTIRDDAKGLIFKGVGFIQVPPLGPIARGFWLSEDSVDPGKHRVAVGDVEFGETHGT